MGLITRHRSFLEQEHWQTVPWATNPEAQCAQSRLLSILAFVPGYLEDDARLDLDFNLKLHGDLIKHLTSQLEQIFAWRWRWEEDNPLSSWEERNGRKASLGPAVRFASLTQGVEIMTYNAVLIWILGLLWKLDPHNVPSHICNAANGTQFNSSSQYITVGPLHLPGQSIQLWDIAIEICRVFDFVIRNIKNKVVSSLFFLMPIGLACSVLDHDERWTKAINDSLASSHVTTGYKTGQNIFGFGSYAFPKIPKQVIESFSSKLI